MIKTSRIDSNSVPPTASSLASLSDGGWTVGRLVGRAVWMVALEEVEEAGDLDSFLCGVAHGRFGVDPVVVSSSLALAVDVASLDEVAEYALGGALSDAHASGDVAKAEVGHLGEAEQYLCVVREERPSGWFIPA